MQLKQKDLKIEERCVYIELSLYGMEADALLEVVSNFKNMG